MKTIFLLALGLILSGCNKEAARLNEMGDSTKPASVAENRILPQISSYSAPAYPSVGTRNKESYDYRLESWYPVPIPPSKVDVLVCDLLLQLTKSNNQITISSEQISEYNVRDAVRSYEHSSWRNIPGLRPWTHWNFIKQLSAKDRRLLAHEVHAYMLSHGINKGEVDKEELNEFFLKTVQKQEQALWRHEHAKRMVASRETTIELEREILKRMKAAKRDWTKTYRDSRSDLAESLKILTKLKRELHEARAEWIKCSAEVAFLKKELGR